MASATPSSSTFHERVTCQILPEVQRVGSCTETLVAQLGSSRTMRLSHLVACGAVVCWAACATDQPAVDAGTEPDAGVDAGGDDAGGVDAGGVDAGGVDAGEFDAGADAGLAAIFAKIPNLVICKPAADPWVHKTEMSPTTTHYQACATVCADWQACTVETTARNATQVEVNYVVDEDGHGNGFGGTLRFSKSGSRDHVVLFHKGGSGTEYVDDDLPAKVEAAGGTSIEPKWVAEADTAVGWFSRPFADSTLEKNLYGVSLRPAAIFKWVWQNLATAPFSTAGCSGGSIATYYPRHWHGLDVVLRYQLLSGGPVMSKLQAGCGSADKGKGRCTNAPTIECLKDAQCGADGGTCSPYQWKKLDLVMKAVRGTVDHLHAHATSGSSDCEMGTAQPAFDVSDFDSSAHAFDRSNEHRIDFMTNVGATLADDYLNVVASGAAVYSGLTGPKSWTAQFSGVHCDSFKSDAGWYLLKAGAGL